MEQKNSVLLSIGIPTFNRAELLQSALYSLAPQIKEFQGEVELIVSDNNSQDNTADVVKWAQQFGPIRYNKNDENIGAGKNFVFLATQLAKGEYIWLLGDDDFVRPGGVKRILEVIKEHPDVEYINVNVSNFTTEQLNKYPKPVSSKDLPYDLPLNNKDLKEYYVERWENLIKPEITGWFLTGIFMGVIRRNAWQRTASKLEIGESFTSLESSYPHTIIYAKYLVGKPAYYIGTPYVVVINGAREFVGYALKLGTIYLHEVLDCYELHGVNHDQIEKCRVSLVKNNCGIILNVVLTGNPTNDISIKLMVTYLIKNLKYVIIAVMDVCNKSTKNTD